MMQPPRNLKHLCESMGIEWHDVDDVAPVRPVAAGDIADSINGYQLADGTGYRAMSAAWDGQILDNLEEPEPFTEIGTPGTPIVGGIVRQEPTAKYGPYQVRGYAGQHSIYEEMYRQEPVLFEGINELNNVWMSGKLALDVPDVPRSQLGEAEEFVAWCNRWLGNIWRGVPYYLQHVGAARIFGFYAFEVVWQIDWKGRIYPAKFAPREPGTVDRWIMTPRADELAAVTFQTSGTTGGTPDVENGGHLAPNRYTLTATGPALFDHRVHVVNINARANNFEGISLIRPIIHWVKFKQAVAQTAAITAQKYGVPIPVIKEMPVVAGMTYNTDQAESTAVFDAIKVIQSPDGPVLQLPPGFEVEMLAAQGTMPSLNALLEYADAMIAKPLNAETSLLANATVGSYALASVLDDRILRAQPGFAAHVLQPLNWMIRDIGLYHGVDLDQWPVFRWSMDGGTDNSKWIADATAAMGGLSMADWPKEMQLEALHKLGLPPATFEGYEAPAAAPAPMFASADVAHTCDDSCEHAFKFGDEAQLFLDMSLDALREGETSETVEGYRLADKDILQPKDPRGMSAEAIDAEIDGIEARIGRRLNPLVVEHQKLWRENVRDGGASPRLAEQRLRDEMLPRYEAVFLEEMARANDKAKRQLLRDYGFSVSKDAVMPVRQQLRDAMALQAYARALEVFNRQQGYMMDSRVGDELGMKKDGVPKLKESTLARIAAGAAGVAYSAGRADLVEKVQETGEARVMAYRTSMLDKNVCEECAALDYEIGSRPAVHVAGSSAYYDDMPPNYCLGGPSRCRCAYIYEIPAELAGTLEEIASAQGFALPS